MDKRKLNISKVETFLYGKLNKVVSDHCFVGVEAPLQRTIPNDWKDMCLIELSSGISDRDAYGVGTALVTLYARPMKDGSKNVTLLSKMENKLLDIIESNTDATYQTSRRFTYAGFDEELGWHYNVVEVILKVF